MIILFGFLFTLQVLEMLNSVNPAKQQLNEKENERKIAAERSEFNPKCKNLNVYNLIILSLGKRIHDKIMPAIRDCCS